MNRLRNGPGVAPYTVGVLVRMGTDKHHEFKLAARDENLTLSQWIAKALADAARVRA